MTLDVGTQLTPVVKELTQEKIARYAEAGNDGPGHAATSASPLISSSSR